MALKPGNGDTGGSERDPRLDLLYRDAAREGPPAHLDAAILSAARREVGARPRPLSALRRWRLPVSIAAVVVLSVSLVTLVSEEGGESLLRDGRWLTVLPEARNVESPERPAEPAPAPEARKRAAVSAPEELSLRRDEAAAKAEAEPRREAEREQARSSAAPAAGSLRLDEGPAKATAAVPKSTVEGNARSSAEPAAGPETGVTSSTVGIRGMALESPPRPAADAPQRQAPTVGVGASAADAAPPVAAPKPMPMEKRAQVEDRPKPLAAKRPPVWRGLEQEPPQKWLERLAELRKQGRSREADELLVEIKRRFPDYPLPSGLE